MSKDNSRDWNIDNVKVNRILTPLVFIAYLTWALANGESVYNSSKPSNWSENMIYYCICASIIYFYASRFFQPDLDQTPNRPGKYSFPMSMEAIEIISRGLYYITRIRKTTFVNWILFFIRPISLAWYFIWEPYALCLTHRGISHWPIIGTMTRIGYLALIEFGVNKLLGTTSSLPFDKFLMMNLSDINFSIYIVLPIYISDLAHIIVDFFESLVKGYDFCVPRNERGYISKILRLVGLKITI